MQATVDQAEARRAALRADAEAALNEAGWLKSFTPALKKQYEDDDLKRRREEVRKLILLATLGYITIILTLNFVVQPAPRLMAMAAESVAVVSQQLALYQLCGGARRRVQVEAIMVASALALVIVALIDFWTSSANLQFAGFMTIATFVFGAVHFCRMPLLSAVLFVALSLLCMAIALHGSAVPPEIRLYPLGSTLASGVFALLGARDFDEVSRRLYLHGLLQQLKIEGLAAENSTLNELSTTDHLTGAANRRAFEMALAAPSSSRVTLLLADLDHFKQLNDRFGHAVGDMCLKSIAGALAERLRPGDIVARIGGDEFAALAFDRSPDESRALTESLCAGVAAHKPEGAPRGVEISISVGAARRQPGESVTEFIARADEALYKAKGAGRNCAVWAPETAPRSEIVSAA